LNEFALFFLDDAFGFAHVHQGFDIVASVVFFVCGARVVQLLLPPQAIERAMPRLSQERQRTIKRPQQRQQAQKLSLRIAQRNKARDELAKYSREDQTQRKRNQQRHAGGPGKAKHDESGQDVEDDQQDLNRSRERKTETGAFLENLFQERRVTRVGVFFGFSGETAQADIAQLAERHINGGQKSDRQKQQRADG